MSDEEAQTIVEQFYADKVQEYRNIIQEKIIERKRYRAMFDQAEAGVDNSPPTAGHIALKDFMVKTTGAFLMKILLEAGH